MRVQHLYLAHPLPQVIAPLSAYLFYPRPRPFPLSLSVSVSFSRFQTLWDNE